jgi:uncharacterized membrane protein (UPF0127 family)
VGRLRERETGRVLADRVEPARGLIARYVGLLTRRNVPPDEGLWFANCHAVHTLGMRATVDLVFVDAHGRVLRCDAGVQPWRPMVSCARADAVIEMGTGFLARAELTIGDALVLDDGDAQPGGSE